MRSLMVGTRCAREGDRTDAGYLGRGTITVFTRVHANVGGAKALQGLLRGDPLLPNLARPDSTHWNYK